MSNFRIERDSFGGIEIPKDKYWGVYTGRSLKNFKIGHELVPAPLIYAFGIQKKAAAIANKGLLGDKIADAIIQAAEEVREGKWDEHFPLLIWQAGSGNQTMANINEVISNRATEILGGKISDKKKIVDPIKHVHLGQSTNDSFVTAMHIATVLEIHKKLLPSLHHFHKALRDKEEEFKKIIKIGRTHLQDATPITLGQVFSAYAEQIKLGIDRILDTLKYLYPLAQGGTVVGTGIASRKIFPEKFVEEVVSMTGLPFVSAPNKFEAQASSDAMVYLSGALNTLAASYMKIANDIRLLGSGPRCGIGELILPANETGSSMMPGKINPTQAEAMTMVAAQVMGNHVTISIAGANGHFELNAFKPVIIYNILQSIELLSDSADNFISRCIIDIRPNMDIINKNLNNALTLVAALIPHIGYDKADLVAKKAYNENITLREAALTLKFINSVEQFDEWVNPEKMIGPEEKSDVRRS